MLQARYLQIQITDTRYKISKSNYVVFYKFIFIHWEGVKIAKTNFSYQLNKRNFANIHQITTYNNENFRISFKFFFRVLG